MTKKIFRLDKESEIYQFWETFGLFRANPTSSKKPYSVLIPPPNLTGELHLGHAMQHSILDAVARFKRLQGFDVLLLPGVDHAGILFEATLDRELEKENLSKEKLGREEWLKKAWQFKEKIYKSVSSTWRFMGLSADWDREVFTLDAGPQKAVFEEFKTYFENGLIYKGPYIVQWCPKCNTAIEDVEMEYEEKEETLYYVRYLIEGTKDEYIEIATARPETIFADSGIAVYPNHSKFKKNVGKRAHIPLGNWPGDSIPIFEDKRVEKDFGTGALKITPGHDLLDYEIGKDHGLTTHQVISKSGTMTTLAGKPNQPFTTKKGSLINGLEGMKVLHARKATVDWLKDNDSLVSEEPYTHSVAVCERCKSVIEPLISEEWFVKAKDIAKDAIKVIKAGKIDFLPKNYAKILIDWLENIHDWCISRSLWWGHRIPVWYLDGKMRVSDKSPGPNWEQDEQVLDTWFSSGLWPMSTLGWPHFVLQSRTSRDKPSIALATEGKPLDKKPGLDPQLAKYYPWDFEISAPEIKFLWIARMIMLGLYFMGDIPFKTMFFHGMLRDLQGRKFSKSLGNGIEPVYLIENWGVDATRMALYTYSIPGRDGRVSREILDERGKNFRNFATKIKNIARFVLESRRESGSDSVILDSIENPEKDSRIRGNDKRSNDNKKKENTSVHADDRWIKDELETTVKKVTKHLDNIELHLAAEEIYDFIWHKFADIYLEKSKARRKSAQPVLEYVLKTSLILLHPFMPFVTEEIYQKFEDRKKSIMLEKWPIIKLSNARILTTNAKG